jgi:hypothetical protein
MKNAAIQVLEVALRVSEANDRNPAEPTPTYKAENRQRITEIKEALTILINDNPKGAK